MEYVGKTTRSVEERFKEHTKSPYRIGKAIRKHGVENFVIAILKVCYSKAELDFWEKHFIKSRNTLSPCGYNLTEGGDGGGVPCDETLAKLSASHMGNRHTDEHKAKIATALKGKKKSPEHCAKMSVVQSGERNSFFGKHHTAEWCAKMSVIQSGEKSFFFGKHYTEEERLNRSLAYRGKSPYKNLLAELDAHKFTYTAFAKILDLSIATISRKMSGKQNFTPEQKERIKNLLGVEMSVEELFKHFDD